MRFELIFSRTGPKRGFIVFIYGAKRKINDLNKRVFGQFVL